MKRFIFLFQMIMLVGCQHHESIILKTNESTISKNNLPSNWWTSLLPIKASFGGASKSGPVKQLIITDSIVINTHWDERSRTRVTTVYNLTAQDKSKLKQAFENLSPDFFKGDVSYCDTKRDRSALIIRLTTKNGNQVYFDGLSKSSDHMIDTLSFPSWLINYEPLLEFICNEKL